MSFLDDLNAKEQQVNEMITQTNSTSALPEKVEEVEEQVTTSVQQSQEPQQQENPNLNYLREQNTRLQNELSQLRQAMTQMQQVIADKNKAPEKPAFEVPKGSTHVDLTDEESTAIGDSKVIVKIVNSQIDAKLTPIIQQLNAVTKTINEQLGTVNQNIQQSERARFDQAVLSAVPDARAMVSDGSKFIQWLNSTNSHGVPLIDNFTSAWNALNAERVISMMRSYINSINKKNEPREKNLESQVEPNTKSTSTNTGDKKIFYFEDYQNAVADLSKKQISKKVFDKIEQEYNEAMIQGRVSFQKRNVR